MSRSNYGKLPIVEVRIVEFKPEEQDMASWPPKGDQWVGFERRFIAKKHREKPV